jgi:hypothetical protein
MTRVSEEQRENWNDDDRKRCKECGLEPEQCNCDKDLSELF